MVNPEGKIDGNRGKSDSGNHDLTIDLTTDLSSPSQNHSSSPSDENGNENSLISETKIVYGTESIMEVANDILTKCRNNYDVYCDKNGPLFMIAMSPYMEVYAKLKDIGVRIRLITEITADNLDAVKRLLLNWLRM